MLLNEINPLKKALDEVLIAEMGFSERESIWLDLWRKYGIILEDLTTLEKMENALQLVVGDDAKTLVRAAFARYLAQKGASRPKLDDEQEEEKLA